MVRGALGAVAALMIAVPAQAAVLQPVGGFQGVTMGIALGPDGNLWVAEQDAGNVVRVAPDGTILARYPVGAFATTVTAGPGGRIWVAVTDDRKLVWFDATSPSPTAHAISTTAISATCGPIGLAAGGNGKLYFTTPNTGFDGCSAGDRLGYVNDDGVGAPTDAGAIGTVFDLAVGGGKLYAPDYDGDVVRRLSTATPPVLEAAINAVGTPSAVTIDPAGTIWVTLFGSGGLARFPASQSSGDAQTIVPTGGVFSGPLDIVNGPDGKLYVTGWGSGNIMRTDGSAFSYFAGGAGASPFRGTAGADGDLWFTGGKNAILHFVDGAPRLGAVSASESRATTKVDARGNETQVAFDVGTTTDYGSSTPAVVVPAGIGPVDASSALTGLAPATTYHLRARATNALGTVTGEDVTFTTAATPAPPVLAAKATFTTKRKGKRWLITKLTVKRLSGGETVKVTCATKKRGCRFKAKTYANVKAGSKSLTRLFGGRRPLKQGAKVDVRITKARAVGSRVVLTVRSGGRKPKLTRTAIQP